MIFKCSYLPNTEPDIAIVADSVEHLKRMLYWWCRYAHWRVQRVPEPLTTPDFILDKPMIYDSSFSAPLADSCSINRVCRTGLMPGCWLYITWE